MKAQESIIIGTYNLQNIKIQQRNRNTSLSEVLIQKAKRNVKILICLAAFMRKSRFINTLRTHPVAHTHKLAIRFCRRMHFKTIIVDLKYAYIGTANISGAGIGLKSQQRRNFELGFVTRDIELIADVGTTFMEIFNGKYCDKCHFFKNSHIQDPCSGILWNSI